MQVETPHCISAFMHSLISMYFVCFSTVNRVRDRVNQLRNRYNLEKRKVDLQKAEGYSNARSSWPLFEHLRFLDGHIRPRKSYKALGRPPRPVGKPRRNNFYKNESFIMYNDHSASLYSNPITLQQQPHPQLQQSVQVKTEPGLNKSNDNESAAYRSEYDT